MKTRILTFVFLLPLLFTGTTEAAPRSIPSSMREASALDAELGRLKRECDTSRSLTNQLRQTVRSTRKDVELAIKGTTTIRSLEQRMNRLIDRLKPYESIPKVRTIARTLRKNLKQVHSKLKTVRRKTDKFESGTLKPLRKKLIAMEGKLRTAESKIREVSTATATSQMQLAQAADLASRNQYSRQSLEAASRAVRPPARNVRSSLGSVNGEVRSVVNDLKRLQGHLSSFRTVDRSLSKLSRDLKPGEKVAADINRVLSKRLEIRLPVPPFKKVGFSIRTILEKPGQVIGVVLKPLEKIADKILQPIIKKAGLQLKMPAGLAAMARSIDQINAMHRGVSQKMDRLNANLSGKLIRDANRFNAIAKQQLGSVTGQTRNAPRTVNRRQNSRSQVVFFAMP